MLSDSLISPDGADAVRLLVKTGVCGSTSEARRLISQGGLKVNGRRIQAFRIPGLRDGDVMQAGKANIIKLRLPSK
jgi:tyrosyl-tRNA synthetase